MRALAGNVVGEESPVHPRLARALVVSLALFAGAVARLSLARPSYAQERERVPRVAFDDKAFVFSSTVQGTHVAHAFAFRNEGDADLVVRRVETSCTCSVVRLSSERVPPGGKGTLEVVLDTSEKAGPHVGARLLLFTNDPEQHDGGAPGTSSLELRGEVVSLYRRPLSGAWFGDVPRGQGGRRDLKVLGLLDASRGFRIVGIDVPSRWIQVAHRPLEGPEAEGEAKSGYAFTVELLPGAPAGDLRSHVTVHTDVARQPSFEIAITGRVVPPVHAPESLSFGRVARGERPERTVAIERSDGRPLEVLGVELDGKHFEVTPGLRTEARRADFHVRVAKDAPPGPVATTLRVLVADPEAPLVTVSIYATIAPAIRAEPAAVVLGPADASARVRLVGAEGRIRSARVEPAGAFAVAAIDSGTLEVRRAEDATRATVVVETDVPGEELVRVPVSAERGGR